MAPLPGMASAAELGHCARVRTKTCLWVDRAQTAGPVQGNYFYHPCHSTKSPGLSRVTFQTAAMGGHIGTK